MNVVRTQSIACSFRAIDCGRRRREGTPPPRACRIHPNHQHFLPSFHFLPSYQPSTSSLPLRNVMIDHPLDHGFSMPINSFSRSRPRPHSSTSLRIRFASPFNSNFSFSFNSPFNFTSRFSFDFASRFYFILLNTTLHPLLRIRFTSHPLSLHTSTTRHRSSQSHGSTCLQLADSHRQSAFTKTTIPTSATPYHRRCFNPTRSMAP